MTSTPWKIVWGKSTLDELAKLNQAYRDKHGYVFLVCATGKSAGEMLAILKDRLPNERALEVGPSVCRPEGSGVVQGRGCVTRLDRSMALPESNVARWSRAVAFRIQHTVGATSI